MIGISQCCSDDWRNKMNEEVEREIMFHPEAKVEIRSADDSNDKQIADIEYFLKNKFDIIIVSPNEAEAITPIVKHVYDSGIPIIIFDRNIIGDSYTARIGADDMEIGHSAAEYAHSLCNKPRVLEISGLAGSTPAIDRHKGFISGLKSVGGTLVATGYGNWNLENAEKCADSLLSVHPDVDIIFAHNDRMAIGAAKAAKAKGLNVKIIGVDAAPEIGIRAVADKIIDATFLYPTEGQQIIRLALAILKGEHFEKETILPSSSAVDLSNADILLLQNKTLKEETNKMKELKKQVDAYWQTHSVQTMLLYALGIIVILLCFLLFLSLRMYWTNKRHQKQLEEQNEKIREATMAKMAFYTSVSHDLRTPLTLIAGPVESIENAENLTQEQKSMMHIASRNAAILKRLINQILDFRKYENGRVELNLKEMNFSECATQWMDSFKNIIGQKGIKFEVSVQDGIHAAMDTEKIERVIFNLMSNAIKHTPQGGTICFKATANGNELVFSVSDTGEGISTKDQDKIFDEFFQAESSNRQGSGIGLSLAKAFIELHGGRITLRSESGKGSEFSVFIPVKHVATDTAAIDSSISGLPLETIDCDDDVITESEQTDDSSKPLALIIDDNADVRLLLRTVLHDKFRLLEASEGSGGIRKAVKYVPDLIICDVMMPGMDGFECCRRLKADVCTSHIPVILLTACSLDEQRAKGYECGAESYISKPFNADVLRSRCINLIKKQRMQKGEVPSGLNAVDDDFYTKLMNIISSRISDSEINVDDLASELSLSRSQFYRKVKSLSGLSPVELIRLTRLKKAKSMIQNSDKSISEIAYATGFSSPAYFTKCYKDAFGQTPTEDRESINRKTS